MRTWTRTAVVGLGVVGALLPASAAAADDDGPRTKRTECSGTSSSVLRVSGDDGNRFTYRVDSRAAGVAWTVTVRGDDGDDRLFTGRRTTNRQGDLTVSGRGDVDDRVVATARNTRTGETCRVVIDRD